MRLLPQASVAGLVLAVMAWGGGDVAGGIGRGEEKPFRAIRSRDQLSLTVGPGILSFNEKIVMTPTDLKEKLVPGRANLLHILIPALWVREGGVERPAFSTQRPYFQASQGRVRRFALLKPDGERVLTPDQMTPECRYVLTLEFGHVIPEKFIVDVSFVSTQGLSPQAELLYTPSNDGYPVRSGPPESFFTELRVRADAPLDPWKVTQDDKPLDRVTPYIVHLQREFSYVIRFAQEL